LYVALELRCDRKIINSVTERCIERTKVTGMKCEEAATDVIKIRMLTLLGDICHMSDQRIIKTLLFGIAEGEWSRERPNRRWIMTSWSGEVQHLYV